MRVSTQLHLCVLGTGSRRTSQLTLQFVFPAPSGNTLRVHEAHEKIGGTARRDPANLDTCYAARFNKTPEAILSAGRTLRGNDTDKKISGRPAIYLADKHVGSASRLLYLY
jgi:hypothetical protein